MNIAQMLNTQMLFESSMWRVATLSEIDSVIRPRN
jgi:hypothetical protein